MKEQELDELVKRLKAFQQSDVYFDLPINPDGLEAATAIQALREQVKDAQKQIEELEEALREFVREQQSEAQAGTGEYQRGYDDCIAVHAKIAARALKKAPTHD